MSDPRPAASARRAQRVLLAGAAGVLALGGAGAVAVAATRGPDLPPPATAAATPAAATPAAATPAPRTSAAAATGAASPSPTAAAPSPSPSLAPALPRSRPVALRIPAIDVDSRSLVRLGLGSDGRIAVPHGPGPVGWFTGSPAPGQAGPAVLLAHVTWNGKRGTFFRLGQLHPGDTATVTRADGATVRFRVYRVATFPKDAFPTAEVYGNTAGPELRLITCGGDYRPGTAEPYPDNVVVFARAVPPGAG